MANEEVFGTDDVTNPTRPRPLVTMVLPMYNESAVFSSSMTDLIDALDAMADRYRFEILIVDDGSTDGTRQLAEQFASVRDEVRVLSHRVNFELGQALRFAFRQSKGDYVVTFDADLTYSPDHVERLLTTIEQTAARIVIASPYMKGGQTIAIPFTRRVLSRYANRFLAFFNQDDLSTITGMVRAYDGPFIRTLDLKAVGADINTEIIQKAQILRARMVEIPATLDWSAMPQDRGARFNRRLYWNTAKQLASGFLFRPFLALVLPGLFLLAAAAVFGVWIVADVASDTGSLGLVESVHDSWRDIPAAFLAFGLLLMLSFQLLLLGLVTFQSKRYFDELFHLNTMVLREVSDEPLLQRRGPVDPPQSG